MTNLLALPGGTELVGDYRIARVLGAGGFGITYLADEMALSRHVTIKEYFPSDFAARANDNDASPRSKDCAGDYKWGLDRFIEEAQTLARFDHPNIVRVYRYFRANNTGYMVLQFEEGQSFKSWLKSLGRAPRQTELDLIVAPLLDALEIIHQGDFLHRDIAPDNIIIRRDNQPVLIDFGSARGEIAAHSRTVSALVKPGYSPYEQYASTSRNQGPWTDIYALGATLYQAVCGKRPPDAPSRMVADEYVSARNVALGSYRASFLVAIDRSLALEVGDRPQSIAVWRGMLLAPEERAAPKTRLGINLGLRRAKDAAVPMLAARAVQADVPPPPDAPQAQGQLLDFIDNLQKPATTPSQRVARAPVATVPLPTLPRPEPARPGRGGLGYGPADDAAATARLGDVRPAAVAGTVPLPAPIARAKAPARIEKRRPVRRAPGKKFWRPLAIKLAIGLGVASALVAYQDHLPDSVQGVRRTGPVAGSPPAAANAIREMLLAGHRGGVTGVAFTDDGRQVASVGADGKLRLWTAATGAALRSIDLDESAPTAFAVSGRRALVGGRDGRVGLIDLERGEKLVTVRFGDTAIVAVAFAGNPDRIAAATADGRVALFDRTASADPVKVLEAHSGGTDALALVAGSNRLLSAGADDTVKQWDVTSGVLLRTYRGHGDRVGVLDVSADGRSLASGARDGGARIWSASANRLVRSIRGDGNPVAAIALSPQAATLAVAGADGAIRIYEARRGRLVATLGGHSGGVRMLAYAPDGKRLVSGGADGSVRIWPVGGPAPARD